MPDAMRSDRCQYCGADLTLPWQVAVAAALTGQRVQTVHSCHGSAKAAYERERARYLSQRRADAHLEETIRRDIEADAFDCYDRGSDPA